MSSVEYFHIILAIICMLKTIFLLFFFMKNKRRNYFRKVLVNFKN